MAIITSLKKFGHMFGPMWVPHGSSASGDVETANNTNREEPNRHVESVVREIAARRSLPCPNPRITSLTSVAPSSANIRAVGTAKRGSVPGGSYSSMITASLYVPPKRGNLGSMARSPMTSSSTLYGSSQHSLAGIREEGTTSSKGEYMEDTRNDEKARGGWIKRLLKLHSRGKEKEMANIAPPVSSESLASISENVVCDGKPSRKNRANDSWWSFRTKGRVAGSAQTLCEPDRDSATPAPIGPDLTSAMPIDPMAKREEKSSAKRLSISKKDCSADLAKDHVGESNEKTFEKPPNPEPVASHSQAGNKWFAALVAKNNKKLRKEVLQSNLLPPEELICHTTEETGGRPESTQGSAMAERKLKSEGYRDKQEGSEKKTIEKRERDESKPEANVTQSMEHSKVADQKQIEEPDLDDTEVKSTTKSNTPSSIETESSYDEPTGLYRSVATNLNDSGHRNSDRSSQSSSVGEQTGVELNEDEVESEAKIREIRLRIAEQYSSGQRKLPFNFRYKYYLLDMLGDGAFGFVMVARRRDGKCNEESQKIQEYAVKFIARGKVSSHLWVDDEALGKIPFEAHILGHLNHPNIVKLVDIYNEDKEYVLMVTEMHGTQWDGVNPLLNASNNPNLRRSSAPVRSLPPPATNSDSIPGHHLMRRRTSCDLFECIDAHTYMAESVGRKIFAQIVEAIYYLNSVGLVHRDLKDENIVIDEHYNVKLIDFGSANWIPTHPADYFYTFNGTINYASPEICRGNPYRGPEAEVWALGVLLYTIVAGQNPFAGPEEIIKGHQNDFPRATRLCADLLRRTLHADPLQRATIQEVRDHPWLAPEGYGDFLTALRHPANSSI